MKIIEISEPIFDQFANFHKYHNFYQTSCYGKLVQKYGFSVQYLGFYNNAEQLIGATLMISRKAFLHYQYAYCPSGFLIDYTNYDFLQELSEKLRKFLFRKHFIFLSIDPPIFCSERDEKGEILSYNPEINTILEILQSCHYQHKGFNRFFEMGKARFNAVVELNKPSNELFKLFHKQTRNKIHKANKSGIIVYKAEAQDLPIFYKFIKKKHNRDLQYYQSLFECFGDKAELYLAKIDAHKYVKETQRAYEQALSKNEVFVNKLQDKRTKGKDMRRIINGKMESDKVLAQEQGNLMRATSLYQKCPEGVIVGGAIVIKHCHEAFLFIEGFDQIYRSFNPNYYLKWDLIQRFSEEGYQMFNLNAIVGDFTKSTRYSGLNEMKFGFGAKAIEYIGDFDFIINPIAYRIYLRKMAKKSVKK